MKQPRIETENLVLRPYSASDFLRVAELASDIRVAETTLNIPHPYSEDIAKHWISMHEANWANRNMVVYAVTLKKDLNVVGTVSLEFIEDAKAELGYWIGYDYWGKGYCSEAASSLINAAFTYFSITVIIAQYLSINPASGKVMRKIGMNKYANTKKPNRHGVLSDIEEYIIEK